MSQNEQIVALLIELVALTKKNNILIQEINENIRKIKGNTS